MSQTFTLSARMLGAINAEAGIIEGVSVISEGPALGHGVMIDATTLETVKACSESYSGGLKVKMNHYSGADAIVGTLRNFRIDGPQLRADLQLLKASPHRALVLEMAQEMPEGFGLSISFSGSVDEEDGVKFARCLEIYSCDIVDQPAANPTGLFSKAMKKMFSAKEILRALGFSADEVKKDETKQGMDMQKCPDCGTEYDSSADKCPECGAANPSLSVDKNDEAMSNAEFVTKLAAANTQILGLKAELEEQRALALEAGREKDKAVAELESYKAKEAERVNAEAARALAASGHAPLEMSNEPGGGNDAKLYEDFQAADSLKRAEMLKDPSKGPKIKAESARRLAAAAK